MFNLQRSELALEHASFGARLDLGLQTPHLALELSLLQILYRRTQHLGKLTPADFVAGLSFPSRYSFFHRESMNGWISKACATSCV